MGCSSWVYENGKVRRQYHDNLMDFFLRDYFPSMNLLLRVSSPFGVQLSVVVKRKIKEKKETPRLSCSSFLFF